MNVFFLGCTQNYSYQFAAVNTKIEFLAKGLQKLGEHCVLHNGIIGTLAVSKKEVKSVTEIGTVITYPKKGNQLVSWILNLPLLIKDLKRCRRDDGNCMVLETPDYHIYLIYVLLARIFKYKIVVISHEWLPTVKSIHPLRIPSASLYTATFGYFIDGILPISEFIIKKIQHFKKPYVKIPVAAEFNQIEEHSSVIKEKYFLYCVYAAYKRVIFQIIDAYIEFNVSAQTDIKLVLVLSGDNAQISVIQNYINQKGQNEDILIKSKVPYAALMALYANALALVIPLDPNSQQDEARFSQKIAEYSSSAAPIISNNVGEMKHYFRDKENAVLCEYSTKGFIDAFRWIFKHPDEAKQIGINGFNLGKKSFDYRKLSFDLHNFIHSL